MCFLCDKRSLRQGSCYFLQILLMQKATKQRLKKGEQQIQSQSVIPMLSQLHIQLPKPTPTRKISTVNQQTSYNNQYQTFFSNQHQDSPEVNFKNHYENRNVEEKTMQFAISKNKHLHSPSHNRSQRQIILGWIRNILSKKELMGVHWQQKIKNKRISLRKWAFDRLKQERQSGISYLQTQSKHKPYFSKQKYLAMMGFEKLNEVFSTMDLKVKRIVFSKILRFLAFQNVPFKTNSKLGMFMLQQESTGSMNSRSNPKQQRNIPQSPNNMNSMKTVFAKDQLIPHRIMMGNDYIVSQKTVVKTPIKQVQSSKNLVFSANQYALTPASPVKELLTDKKKPRKDNFIITQSRMSRNSDSSKISRQLNSSKSQPHQLAIGGIGGNFKYQFNQHNYIVVHPQNTQKMQNLTPSSPVSHQYNPSIKFHTAQLKHMQPIPIFMKQYTQNFERRQPNYVRPHSHNPFITHTNQAPSGSAKLVEQHVENRKSRSISASANIKISFMSKDQLGQKQQNLKKNDYLQEQKLKYQQMYKLGTAQNRKMRQHYQINSYGNQLIPQDYLLSPQTPNYLYSTPVSPKPQQMQPKHLHVNYVTHSPQSPMTHRSPKSFAYQSYLPISPQQQFSKQMKQSVQISSPDTPTKRLLRQKIQVTISQRQR